MSLQSKAYVKIRTKPLAKLFGIRGFYWVRFPLYIHGHDFRISISITNMGTTKFNGGKVIVRVFYAFVKFPENIPADVPPIDAGNTVKLKNLGKWGVLAHGHALFLADLLEKVSPTQYKLIPLCNEKSNLLDRQDNGYHIHSFYALSRGELYTLTALYVSVFSVFLLNFDKIIELFRRLLNS